MTTPKRSGPYPYIEEFGANHKFPEERWPKDKVLEQLRIMAEDEDTFWKTGKCSGTMYGGDPEIFELIGKAFRLYSHVNVLQRDMCPSQTRLEAEIIAMTLDMLHGRAVAEHDSGQTACGVINSGGTESIISALLAHRDKFRVELAAHHPWVVD